MCTAYTLTAPVALGFIEQSSRGTSLAASPWEFDDKAPVSRKSIAYPHDCPLKANNIAYPFWGEVLWRYGLFLWSSPSLICPTYTEHAAECLVCLSGIPGLCYKGSGAASYGMAVSELKYHTLIFSLIISCTLWYPPRYMLPCLRL